MPEGGTQTILLIVPALTVGAQVAPVAVPGPELVQVSVRPVNTCPGDTTVGVLAPKAGLISATWLIVVVSVAVLLVSTGSTTPVGGLMVAVLLMVPLAPAVPVTIKVTLPPLGNVGMTIPAALFCISATVVFAAVGQAPPPVVLSGSQVTPVTVRLATAKSLKIAPLAGCGPALLTTMV